MLTGLAISDFVLIDRLELAPGKGLTVLTGETGAGKSILLDALGAACGARSEAGLVRQGAEKASASASFALSPKHPALALLNENEIGCEDGEIILRRVIGADGRSKAFVNDQPISVGLLKELGARLVEVHGQFDTQGLLDPATHRPALDRFAGCSTTTTEKTWTDWQQALAAESRARHALDSARTEEALLRDEVAELDKLAPQSGEEEKLLEQKRLLQSREKIASALGAALELVSGENGTENQLAQAAKQLARIAESGGERVTRALAHLDTARDAVAEASSLLDSLSEDAGEGGLSLEQVEDRLHELRSAARRHNVLVENLPELAETLRQRLALLSGGDEDLRKLTEASLKTEAAWQKAADDLSLQRVKAAKKLEKAIQGELAPLKMDRAKFGIEIAPASPGPFGRDSVRFLVATNPGTPAGPLDKIASGGELARFMLALKVVLAGTGEAVTLIFDEVDQGVGGAVAAAVGERLAKLGSNVQVLVVTHSPQVAAKGSQHWKVSKAVNGTTTRTRLDVLDASERREEIARMLAGETVTEASRHAATELMQG